eukprot:TRINITY_DN3118_c0_g1_i3.p1 TRINITY_DN3118_c0_g1~~TRINITY_DN3118_c0_g1_i3.p1  ORF type:complete len:1111 (+),score=260.98 TRINITY_DN3118_c0_g1_i3:2174-5506(+)
MKKSRSKTSLLLSNDADFDISTHEHTLSFSLEEFEQAYFSRKGMDIEFVKHLLVLLNHSDLQFLGNALPNPCKIGEFVFYFKTMIAYKNDILSELELELSLLFLFQEIDSDNDGFIRWKQFTEFLAESVITTTSQFVSFTQNLHLKKTLNLSVETGEPLIERMIYFEDPMDKFGVCKGQSLVVVDSESFQIIKDINVHEGAVNSAILIPEFKKYPAQLVTVAMDHVVRFFDPILYTFKGSCLLTSPALCMECRQTQRLLFCGTVDGNIFVIDIDTYTILNVLGSNTPEDVTNFTVHKTEIEPKTSFWTPPPHKNIDSLIKHFIHKNSMISIEQQKNEDRKNEKKSKHSRKSKDELAMPQTKKQYLRSLINEAHLQHFTSTEESNSEIVLSILDLPLFGVIAVGYMDGTIRFWSLRKNICKKILRGHKKAVIAMAWSSEAYCLVSASLDRSIYVWNGVHERPVAELSGHLSSITGMAMVSSVCIASLDVEGTVKLWDLKNSTCIQSLTCGTRETLPMVSIVATSQDFDFAVASSRSIHLFSKEMTIDPSHTSQSPICSVIFLEAVLYFITLSKNQFTVWNAVDGRLLRTYTHDCDLVCACKGYRGKCVIVGDINGNVFSINTQNFKITVRTEQLCGEIIGVAYHSHLRRIYVACNRSIYVFEENQQAPLLVDIWKQQYPNTPNPFEHSSEITCMDYSYEHNIIATGDIEGHVRFWSPETFSCLNLSEDNQHDVYVSCITNLGKYTGFASADALGNVCVWTVKPAKRPFVKVGQISVLDNESILKTPRTSKFFDSSNPDLNMINPKANVNKDRCVSYFVIGAIAFNDNLDELIVGDETGRLTVFNISTIVNSSTFLKQDILSFDQRLFLTETEDIELNPSFEIKKVFYHSETPEKSKSIQFLQTLKRPSAIFSSSKDCTVNIFTSDGDVFGRLQQGGGRHVDMMWNLSFDEKQRDLDEQELFKNTIQFVREFHDPIIEDFCKKDNKVIQSEIPSARNEKKDFMYTKRPSSVMERRKQLKSLQEKYSAVSYNEMRDNVINGQAVDSPVFRDALSQLYSKNGDLSDDENEKSPISSNIKRLNFSSATDLQNFLEGFDDPQLQALGSDLKDFLTR